MLLTIANLSYLQGVVEAAIEHSKLHLNRAQRIVHQICV